MADGNMGDLSFSLTLKSRIEQETTKIIDELKRVDATGKRAQQALEAIAVAAKGVGSGNEHAFDKLKKVMDSVITDIQVFQSIDYANPKKAKQLEQVDNRLNRIKNIIDEISKSGVGIDIFPNRIATETNKAEIEFRKLASIIGELNKKEGQGLNLLGVNATNNIRGASLELIKFRSIFEQIKNNGGIHPITGLTASDVINSYKYKQELDAAKVYAREIKQEIAEVEKARKKEENAAAAEYDRKKKQRENEKRAREEELKSMSDYAKRYMVLQEAKRVADKKSAGEAEKQRQAEIKNSERRYDSLGNKVRQLRAEFSRGISIGADTRKAEGEILRLMSVMRNIRDIENSLKSESGWKSALGKLGNLGNGHDTTIAGRALEDQKAINREVQKGIAEREREEAKARKKEEDAAASEYDRKKKQRENEKRAREEELKSMSDYIKRYMTLLEKRREMAEKAGITPFFKNDQGLKNIKAEIDTLLVRLGKVREDITLYQHAIGSGTKESINFGQQGLKEANAEAEMLMSTITKLQNVYDTLRASQANVGELVGQTPERQRQADIQARMSEYYKKLEKESAKAAAKAEKEENEEKRKNIRDEKRRQTEIKNTERRYDSLGNKVRQLRAEFSKGIAVGADVSKAENEIHRLIAIMRGLKNIGNLLKNPDKWRDFLGALGSIGSGHDTTLASRVLQDQRAVNREARMGVEIEQKRQKEIAKSGARVQADLVRGFERANSHAGKLNSTLQDLKSLFLQGGLVFGAQQFAMSIITTGGEMEKQHIALQSILGDIQNANTMFNQIKELALNSPFTFSELNRDVKQLAAYGVEYEDLYDTTKRLADMSSGLGVSFDRIALAFGQVQSRGWLDGKELRQIAYAGIPLLNKLSEFYSKQEGRNVSTSEIKKRISNREVSFDDVKSIFWQMTSEGGQFFNMQQVLSETLLGRYNKLKDAWEIMLADFADGKSVVGGTFKFIIDQVTNLVQLMHTFSLAALGAMSGFALKKMSMLLAGSAASNFLTNKEKLAQDIKARVLMGQQLSAVEQRILATKKLITKEDLQALVAAKATTKTELQRLYLSGKISRELYKQAVTQAGMNTFWTNFANRGGVAISLLGKGIGSMVSSLWTMIGGLPGLLITAFSVGIGYVISKYRELSQSIEQTQNELDDKLKQIRNFRSDNNSNLIKALASKDTKEIDNLIDTYKEKLKELAPYNFNNIVMGAEEKKSHEERLKYLDQELQKLEDADKAAKGRLLDRDNYSDLKSAIEYANQFYDNKDKLTYRYIADGVDKNVARQKAFSVDRYAEFNANRIRDRIAEIFGDIKKDDGIRLQAEQAMSNIFSALGVPEDRANEIRASVLQAFGIGEKDSWLQGEVRSKMQSLIDSSFPRIGAKIRANKDLTKAEQDKVRELMDDAKQGLIRQYPELEKTLQNLLNSSKFQAVIKLVYTTDDKYNDMTSELVGRMPNALDPDVESKYLNFAKKWGKDNSYYGGRNAAKADIDAAYNEYQSALKSKSKDANQKRDAWLLVKDAAKALLYYDYSGEGKKSNKPGKKGKQEDAELKALQERLSSLKSARQMYQKYQTRFDDDYSKEKTMKLFPEVTGLNLDDYEEAVQSLLKGFKINTTERKKFQTSVYREVAEWIFDEKDKKVFDEKAATFAEELNRLASNWDLYKELLQKTGNKDFASAAFSTSPYLIDKKVSELMFDYQDKYGKDFKKQDFMSLSDGQAKSLLKGPGEYEAWKKITDLLRDNYVKALQDGADAIQQTMPVAKKLDSITTKYDEKRKKTTDKDLIERYNYLEGQEKSGVLFDQMKSEVNWDGVFGNLDKYTKKGLRKIRKQLRDLVSGGILDGMSTTDLKSFYDGMERLNQAIDGKSFGGLKELIGEMVAASKEYDDAVKEYNDAVEKYGKDSWQAEKALMKKNSSENRKKQAEGSITTKKNNDLDNIVTLANMFKTLGMSNGNGSAILGNAGAWTSQIMTMSGASDKNSQKVGGIVGMFAGLTEAIAEKGFGGFLSDAFEDIGSAVNSIFKDMLGINLGISGADYSDYNKAKDEYNNLISVWDSLISKKRTYLSENWGVEAQNASKEALALLKSEIEQTKVIARDRLSAGASIGSHTIGYRMWEGSYKYDGKNWKDVAGEISRRYGVTFSGMADMLNMSPDVLEKIKTDYSGLWAKMDSDFKEYLDKLIEYGDQVDDMNDSITEKLTGNKFTDLVSSWGDAMASMANSSDNLVEHFEDNLKKAILNSMISNIYGEKIKSLIAKTQKYAENGDKLYDSDGNVISDYTGYEYADIKSSTEDLSKQIEATRDYLKKVYGWSDSSSSSSRNSVNSITEEQSDILISYVNSIRLDLSVMRSEQAKYLPEMSEIAKSQLSQLDTIAKNTLRNADAAERIESIFIEYNSNFNKVLNGTKSLRIG